MERKRGEKERRKERYDEDRRTEREGKEEISNAGKGKMMKVGG